MARLTIPWDPFDPLDPGPIIKVVVMNSSLSIEAGRALGFEYPVSVEVSALLDTGAAVTIISKTFANHCRLIQTGEGSNIRALGSAHQCGEHAGSISFPGTELKAFDPIRILSADFFKEPNYACLIGRDILRHWKICFDGPSKLVTISD